MKKSALLAFLAVSGCGLLPGGVEEADSGPSVAARLDTLRITLDLVGEMDTVSHEFISPEHGGSVAYLVEEGPVEEGELLVGFETEELEDALENAQSDLEQTQFQYDNELESINLRRVQAENALNLARERLKSAQRDYERTEILVQEGVYKPLDLEQSAYALLQAEQDLEERILSNETQENQFELDIANRQRNIDRVQERLDDLQERLGGSEVYAERGGLIVHVESWYGQWRKPQVGDRVGGGRPVVDFPDTSAFLVVVKINERDIDRVAVGMPVEISIDALPGRTLSGNVQKISELATSDMGTGSITFSAQGEAKGFRAEILVSDPEAAETCPTPLAILGDEATPPSGADEAEIRGQGPRPGGERPGGGGRPGDGGPRHGDFGGAGGRGPGGGQMVAMGVGGDQGAGAPFPQPRQGNGARCRGLRPGMTSLARIVLEELAQVVVLPRAAIFLVDGQTVAYRVSDAGWDRVELKLGGLAPQEAEVLSGAAPGENFLLVAPEGDATPTSADGPATPGSPFGNGAGKGNHGK